MIAALPRRHGRWGALAVALLLVGTACSRGGSTEGPTGGSASNLAAQVASYDLAAGSPSRFLVGLWTKDGGVVTGGKVQMRFFYLGTKGGPVPLPPAAKAEGTFLPIPVEKGDRGQGPEAPPGDAAQGTGVYAAQVTFDKSGIWKVEVDRGSRGPSARADAIFNVLPQHKVPAPGQDAPRSENLTMGSADAPAAIDSRAHSLDTVPDPQLHATTIKDAIQAKRATLVVVSTPTYCVSRFCGPVTDMVAGPAKDYAGKAAFVHIEVWQDRQGNTINKAAAEWIYRDGDLEEPWVFLVGADGRVLARWDNVATRGEIEPALQALPMSAGARLHARA